jgi:23S rRNA (guanosine2251-2'-O)-methyltransferase
MSDIIVGRNAVVEALRSGQTIEKVFLARGLHGRIVTEVRRRARGSGVPVEEVPRAKLDALSGATKHQGVVALGAAAPYLDLDDIRQRAVARQEPPLIAVLDGIEDPRNLGAIMRCAESAGVHGIVVPKRRAAGLTAAAIKAAAGAHAHLPVVRVTNIAALLDELKKEGLWIIGADPGADKIFYEAELSGPSAIVIGGESGMRRLVRERCDVLVRIPMYGAVASLNASVAAALLFYEVRRQRTRLSLRGSSPDGE